MKSKREKKIAVLVLFFLILFFISPVDGTRQIYSEARTSDEGIHLYFSDALEEAGNCLDMFIDENPNADNFASSLEFRMSLTEDESRFYAAKEIESNVSWVVKPFSSLSKGIKKITSYQHVFLSNYEILKNESNYSAYMSAKKAILNMRRGADEINSSLDAIEKTELWNETSKLLFNVSKMRERIKDVYALIDAYENRLEKYELEAPEFKELVVLVSDEHPIIYQEITISVYARNVTPRLVFIDNSTYELKNQTKQNKGHSFEKSNEFEIFAIGIKGNETIKSNIVKVYVDKIPTFITLSSKYLAFLNEQAKITGYLLDYYNEPLHRANVTVKAGGEEAELATDRGYFYFYGTRSSEGNLTISAFYPGNNIYKSSKENLSIFFSRFPISIYIEPSKTNINVNETVNFTGSVRSIEKNYSIPLNIFVNGGNAKTFIANKDFGFSLYFSSPGTYEIYALFIGDSMYKSAKSNVVKLTVTKRGEKLNISVMKEDEKSTIREEKKPDIYREFDILFYFLLFFIAIVSFFAGLYARALKRKIFTFVKKASAPIALISQSLCICALKIKKKFPILRDKFFTPIFVVLYARFKMILHALSKNRICALKEKICTTVRIASIPIALISQALYACILKAKRVLCILKDKILIPIDLILAVLRALKSQHTSEVNSSREKRSAEKREHAGNPEAGVMREIKIEEPKVDVLGNLDVEGAYKLLFDIIANKHEFKKSTTPREAVKVLKKEVFSETLERLTGLHEKAVYGMIELRDDEKEVYFNLIREILSEVRDNI